MSNLLTYWLHSAVILSVTLLLVRLPGLRRAGPRDGLLRGALLMSVLTPLIAPSVTRVTPVSSSIAVSPALLTPARPAVTAPAKEGSSRPQDASAPEHPARQTLPEPTPFSLPMSLPPLFPALLLLGVLTAAVRLGRAWWTLRRLLKRGRPAPGFAAAYGSSLPHPFGTLNVVLTDVTVPVACGRRTVLLPKMLLVRLTPSQVRAVLAHETAHLRRADPLWTAALSGFCQVLFFQPLNFLVLRQWRRACEEVCDAEAVRATLEPLSLARSLLELSRSLSHHAHAPLEPVTSSAAGSHLSTRINALLNPKETHMKRSHLFAVAMALFCATALLPTLTLAQDTPRFFQKVAADASTSKSLEEIRGSFIFTEGDLTAESITLDEFPATELVQKVPYEVLTPSDWPGAYVQPATFGYLQPQNTVIAIYDVTQPEGESIEFWFSQQPEETAGLPILIGASAQIETVSVGETTGEWVEGGWSGPDSSLTWDNVGDSTLVWQQNGFVFMVQAFDMVELDTLLKIANSLQPLEPR